MTTSTFMRFAGYCLRTGVFRLPLARGDVGSECSFSLLPRSVLLPASLSPCACFRG